MALRRYYNVLIAYVYYYATTRQMNAGEYCSIIMIRVICVVCVCGHVYKKKTTYYDVVFVYNVRVCILRYDIIIITYNVLLKYKTLELWVDLPYTVCFTRKRICFLGGRNITHVRIVT